MTPQIINLKDNECYGCSACIQVCNHKALEMIENKEGFLYPSLVQDNCVNCGLCDKVCPSITPLKTETNAPKVYAAYNNSTKVLTKSSSGGLFSVFAEYVIDHSGVVFGVVQEDDFKVVHTYTETLDGLIPMRGSKYVQSEIGNAFVDARRFLRQGRLVLFTGTPCQIGGLYGYLNRKYDNLITCELICHGAPSQKLLKEYCEKIDVDIANSPRIIFRDTRIWNYLTSESYRNKTKIIFGKRDYYMKAFFKLYTFRESCYACQYAKLPRIADITIADFWGLSKSSIAYNGRGTSLVLLNSKLGENYFKLVKCKLTYQEREIEEAIKFNHNIIEPCHRPDKRDTFYQDHEKSSINEINNKYGLNPTLRNYVGLMKRTLEKMIYKII